MFHSVADTAVVPALDEEEVASGFCGAEGERRWKDNPKSKFIITPRERAGRILVRPAPENVAPNGKSFHIHTFGCQVSSPPHMHACKYATHADSGHKLAVLGSMAM